MDGILNIIIASITNVISRILNDKVGFSKTPQLISLVQSEVSKSGK